MALVLIGVTLISHDIQRYDRFFYRIQRCSATHSRRHMQSATTNSTVVPATIPRLRFNVLSIDYVRVINCFYDYDYDYDYDNW